MLAEMDSQLLGAIVSFTEVLELSACHSTEPFELHRVHYEVGE